MTFVLATIALMVWALIVAGIDWRSRRIPNGLLLVAVVAGIGVFVVQGRGWLGHALSDSVIGMLLPLIVLLPGFLLQALGGGDVKFALCCGWFLGARDSALMLLGTALLLGLVCAIGWGMHRSWRGPRHRIAAGPVIATGFIAALCARPVFGL